MPATENPPAEPTTSSPHEETKDQTTTPGHPPTDFLEIGKTRAGNPTSLLTEPNPTGTIPLSKAENLTESAIVAASTAGAKKAELLIRNGTRTTGKNAMNPVASLPIRDKTVKDRSGLTAPNHPIIVLIRIDGADRIPASQLTEGLTRKDRTKGREENRLLVKTIRSGAKIRLNQNGLLTSLAASGRRNLL